MITKVTSFDVFDTLITRIVGSPKDVFLVMQGRMRSSIPSLSERFIRSFWGTRVWSEYAVRQGSEADDITLDDIYGYIGARCLLSTDEMQSLRALELLVESEMLYPISGAGRLVDEARQQGDVVFVSDSYLPVTFIRGILIRYGILNPAENLFVSGALGRSKRSGRLFLHIMKELKVPASSLTHFGDNIFSDVVVPRRLGMRVHAAASNPGLLQRFYMTYRERGRYALELLRARRLVQDAVSD